MRHTPTAVGVNGPEGQSTFALRPPTTRRAPGLAGECRAPLPGAVTKVLVSVGDTVAEGDGLVVLEAMKMEHTLRADGAGRSARSTVAPGQQVDVGDLLVRWSRHDDERARALRIANCSGFFGDRRARPATWSRAGPSTSSRATGWPS